MNDLQMLDRIIALEKKVEALTRIADIMVEAMKEYDYSLLELRHKDSINDERRNL